MSRYAAVRKRWASAAVIAALGAAITIAMWLSGDRGFAVALGVFYVVAAIVVYAVAGGRSDVAAIMRTDGDERQRGIDREATRISGVAMGVFAIAGTIVQLARGEDPTAYAWVCTVGGIAYIVALAILRRRT